MEISDSSSSKGSFFSKKVPIWWIFVLSTLALALLVGFIVALAFAVQSDDSEESSSVKVGVFVPSDLTSQYGEYSRVVDVLNFARDELVKSKKTKYELVTKDDSNIESSLKEFKDEGIDLIIGPFFSRDLKIAKPIAEKNGQVLLSPTSTAKSLDENDNIFRFTKNTESLAEATIVLLSQLDVKCLVSIGIDDIHSRDYLPETQAQFKRWIQDSNTYEPIYYPQDASNFTQYLSQLISVMQSHVSECCDVNEATDPSDIFDPDFSSLNCHFGVHVSGNEEVAELLKEASDMDSLVLDTAKWIGSDSTVLNPAISSNSQAAEFAVLVGGFPGLSFVGHNYGDLQYLQTANAIQNNLQFSPSPLAMLVYDLVYFAHAVIQSKEGGDKLTLKEAVISTAKGFSGATGWFGISETGDRQSGEYIIFGLEAKEEIFSNDTITFDQNSTFTGQESVTISFYWKERGGVSFTTKKPSLKTFQRESHVLSIVNELANTTLCVVESQQTLPDSSIAWEKVVEKANLESYTENVTICISSCEETSSFCGTIEFFLPSDPTGLGASSTITFGGETYSRAWRKNYIDGSIRHQVIIGKTTSTKRQLPWAITRYDVTTQSDTSLAGRDAPLTKNIDAAWEIMRNHPAYAKVDGQPVTFEDIPPLNIDGSMFVEMAGLFTALGYELQWNGAPYYLAVAKRFDMEVVVQLGNSYAEKYINGKLAEKVRLVYPPFVAVGNNEDYNRIMLPLSGIAQLCGADVVWVGETRTAEVTSGIPYYFDYGDYIIWTDQRYGNPGGCPDGFCQGKCPTGTFFDLQARYCVQTNFGSYFAIGNFPTYMRDRCIYLENNVWTSTQIDCNANSWPLDKVLEIVDTSLASLPPGSLETVQTLIESHTEIYNLPFENHDLSTPGMFSPNGAQKFLFKRSEEPYAPFVLSARRQTDQTVKTLYLLLPEQIRQDYGFILPDKIAQNPRAYTPYIQKKSKIIIVGSFMGTRGITDTNDKHYIPVVVRHERELFKLRTTLALVDQTIGIQSVEAVLYGMGDSVTSYGSVMRQKITERFNRIVASFGRQDLIDSGSASITWGADELVHMAFARVLPTRKIWVRMSNPNSKHHYDGLKTTNEVFLEKYPIAGLELVQDRNQADMEVHILTREPSIETKIAQGIRVPNDRLYTGHLGQDYEEDVRLQREHDENFMSFFNSYTQQDFRKAILVDARVPNGAWDEITVLPNTCDILTFGGWGTFANNVGYSLGVAKVMFDYQERTGNYANSKRMYLESIAHDVWANGYKWGQKSGFKDLIEDVFVPGQYPQKIQFNHHAGYSNPNVVFEVFMKLTPWVNQEIKKRVTAANCIPQGIDQPFKFTAQFWRTFESECHMWVANGQASSGPNDYFTPGVYRYGDIPGALSTSTMPWVLDPTSRDPTKTGMTFVDMDFLLQEPSSTK